LARNCSHEWCGRRAADARRVRGRRAGGAAYWHAPREFATSVLLRSPLVPPDPPDPTADLRGAIIAALDTLQIDPAGVKAHEALTATYITAARTHRAATRRLGVPYGTYRRHLALAKERLIEQLLRRSATTSTPTPPPSPSEE
jgi:DNA-directed RNA polymerase specialized sigma24 family protein